MRPPGRRGRGLRRAGPGGRGGRVCVSGGGRRSGSEGGCGGLFARSRVPGGLGARPGTARGARGVRDCVRARACLWRGAAGCVSAYALGRHCACPGAVPPAWGCFPNRLPAETGSAAAPAGVGSAAPTGLQRPGRPWDCRQTPEGGRGRAPGRGPEACPLGEAKVGRLRQMDGERKVARQTEMGRRVGRETAKRTAQEDRESLRKKTDRQRPRPAEGLND